MNRNVAALLPCLALLAGCGTASVSGGGSATTAGSPPSTSGTTSPGPASFPLTVSRTGGIAGFNDTIVIRADGQATVSAKQGAATSCRIGADALATLTGQLTGLLNAPKPTPPTATPNHVRADALIFTVTDPAGKSVKVPDPPTGPAEQAVVALVDDVTGPTPPHQICRSS